MSSEIFKKRTASERQ